MDYTNGTAFAGEASVVRTRIGELLENFVLELVNEQIRQLHLPNLKVQEIRPNFNGGVLNIEARIANVGIAPSQPCDIQTAVTLDFTGATYHGGGFCPALNPGERGRWLSGGTFPQVTWGDADVLSVTVVVDPPTAAHPGGAVREGNEEDNIGWYFHIRLTPDPEDDGDLGLDDIGTDVPEPEPPDPPIHG